MLVLVNSLKNYTVAPNDVDLRAAMCRMAELCVEYYASKGYPPRRKGRVMRELFRDSLKIGIWPSVLEGDFDPSFKTKVDAYLQKVNNDAEKAANAMLRQCRYVIDQICAENA